ncbi:MAG: PDZ domain-containing protein [Roseburia sp.]|nr:PDZ domain-containing protein [Roseburia sp.]
MDEKQNDANKAFNENKEDKAPIEASDFDFLQERIKERPINRRRLFRQMVTTATFAILFGVLACLTFLLLEPVLNNWLYPEEEPNVVTFPQEQDEMLPGDMLTEDESRTEGSGQFGARPIVSPSEMLDQIAASLTEESEQASEENQEGDPSEDETSEDAETETEDAEALLKGYMSTYEELHGVYRRTLTSMVTVTAVRSDVDLFNDTYQSEGTVAGVIIANNNRELLILTRKEPLDDAESIRVSFCDGAEAEAVIKKFDGNTKLAVLAVDLKYIDEDTLDYVSVASLGSSAYSGIIGTPVIAIGNLFGYKDNVCYGMVTSKDNVIALADNEYELITTDIYASADPSGILVNLEGDVIGVIDNSYNHSDTRNLMSAIGITELKGMITKLSNGDDIPYLGIYAQDISRQARMELGLPQGAYIFDIDMDSPAMQNGIQKGDILVQIGQQEIRTAADYMNALRGAPIDRNIQIVVLRAGVEEYEEIRFLVQPTLQPGM